ncbi:hypothetical protein [Rhodopirellula sp. MGV]|uniref:hypothetical protein n=1 Tax=Rhodopirellula sp. MGV TaxID=2023130 RepID=UPI000B9637A6|nr:hypothetical protein [Rhodopirellula sp. MGV]OYP34334.1 hypothetical protein CGZ80_14820 [Rhodopirellula sp. MGV]PNY35265.1 hypothetical protein C2E31_19170 [Rhodopirellula baltica]
MKWSVVRGGHVIKIVTQMMKVYWPFASFVPVALLLVLGCDWHNELREASTDDHRMAIGHRLFVDATIGDLVDRVEMGEATAAIIYANWACCADPLGGLGHNTIADALAAQQIVTLSVDLTNVDSDAMPPLSKMGVVEIPALLLFDSRTGASPVILTSDDSDHEILAAIARMDA